MQFLRLSMTLLLCCACGCGALVETSLVRTPASLGAAKSVLVLQGSPSGGPGLVLRFAAQASGAVQPESIMTLPPELFLPESIAVDDYGKIYVAGRTASANSEIVVFAPGASGAATPLRIMVGGPVNPGAMTVDRQGNLYVALDNAIEIFTPTDVVPSRTITGAATLLFATNGIELDSHGNIFITTGISGSGPLLVFDATSTGNAAPLRIVSTVNGAPLDDSTGIAFDSQGALFVVGNEGPPAGAIIFQIPASSSGNATAATVISGPAARIAGVGSLRIDAVGNRYARVSTAMQSGTANGSIASVAVFAAGATGNTAPRSYFSSPSWTDNSYGQMALE
jgi:hypothetical protein